MTGCTFGLTATLDTMTPWRLSLRVRSKPPKSPEMACMDHMGTVFHLPNPKRTPHPTCTPACAAYHPRLHLLGISTVAGNQTLSKVTRNALDVLHAAGIQGIPVVPGASKPLVRPSPILCPEIHGESGLDGPQGGPLLPRSPQQPCEGKAINIMGEAIINQHAASGGSSKIR